MILKHKEKIKKILFWTKIKFDFILQTYFYGQRYKTLDKKLFEKTLDKDVIKKYKKIK